MPQHHMVIPHYMGMSRDDDNESKDMEIPNTDKSVKRQESFSSRSSFQDIPLLMPQEADGLDTFKGEPKLNGSNKEHGFYDQTSRMNNRNPFSFRKSKIEPLSADMPMKGFVDDKDASGMQQELSSMQSGIRAPHKEWWESQDRGGLVDLSDESGQVGPRVSCRCQVRLTIMYLWFFG